MENESPALDWFAALALHERLSLIGRRPASPMSDPSESWARRHRTDLARVRRFDASDRPLPDWVCTFEAAYAGRRVRWARGAVPDLVATLAAPLTVRARDDLGEAILAGRGVLTPASAAGRRRLAASFEAMLWDRLATALMKVAVLEMGVASRSGLLVGETGEERHAFFVEGLSDPSFARSILSQYPVLVRRLVSIVADWRRSSLNLLARLSASRDLLRTALWQGRPSGALLTVEATGDVHGRGDAVQILAFESGERVVYKPRDVAMECLFATIVGWFNRLGAGPDLKAAVTLDAGGHGWMEFVEPLACGTNAEIERFFLRQGAIVALTSILGGSDFHFENVIAHGEYPVLVDLETLFQIPHVDSRLPAASARATAILSSSVLATCILPEPTYYGDKEKWVDWSALGNTDGQMTPVPVPVWRETATDGMRLAYDHLAMRGGTSLPVLDGARVPVKETGDCVVRGFRDAYRAIARSRSDLLRPGGPAAAALGRPARHILRGTVLYAELIERTNHPSHLTDALVAEAALHRALAQSSDARIVTPEAEEAEVAQMMTGAIPSFSAPVGTLCVLTRRLESDGSSGDGWRDFRERVDRLGEDDLSFQESLLRSSFAAIGSPSRRDRAAGETLPAPDEGALLDAATAIGERLLASAVTSGKGATWFAFTPLAGPHIVARVAEPDLYDGLAGIALFLGQLGAIVDDARFRAAAVAAIEESLALSGAGGASGMPPGAYDGTTGLAYVIVQLSAVLDRPDWLRRASDLTIASLARARRAAALDLVSGKAGVLVAATAIARATGEARILEMAEPLAARIATLLRSTGRQRRARIPNLAEAGLAHGRAGLAFALARWRAATDGTPDLSEGRAAFDEDLAAIAGREPGRHPAKGEASVVGWCRGRLGIALALLDRALAPGIVSPFAASLARQVAAEIVASRHVDEPSFCHGSLGHLELIRRGEEAGILDRHADLAAWRSDVLNDLLGAEERMRQASGFVHPGLMTGSAGIGYALLREVRPDAVPSILTLG